MQCHYNHISSYCSIQPRTSHSAHHYRCLLWINELAAKKNSMYPEDSSNGQQSMFFFVLLTLCPFTLDKEQGNRGTGSALASESSILYISCIKTNNKCPRSTSDTTGSGYFTRTRDLPEMLQRQRGFLHENNQQSRRPRLSSFSFRKESHFFGNSGLFRFYFFDSTKATILPLTTISPQHEKRPFHFISLCIVFDVPVLTECSYYIPIFSSCAWEASADFVMTLFFLLSSAFTFCPLF